MSRRREINNNAQRRFRQRQRDRLQTLEDKLAAMTLEKAHLETHIQRIGETQVGVVGIRNYANATNWVLVTGSIHGWWGRDGGQQSCRRPLSETQAGLSGSC